VLTEFRNLFFSIFDDRPNKKYCRIAPLQCAMRSKLLHSIIPLFCVLRQELCRNTSYSTQSFGGLKGLVRVDIILGDTRSCTMLCDMELTKRTTHNLAGVGNVRSFAVCQWSDIEDELLQFLG
jgi:hypothetical protein